MGTSSSIGITSKHEPYNGTVKSITCHWDGYPDYMGHMLVHNYDTRDKVEELIALGDLSSIHSKVKPTTKSHSFDNPEEDVTVAYARDRGESYEDNAPFTYASIKDFRAQQSEAYAYLFDIDKNDWFIAYPSKVIRLPDKYRKDD